MKPFEELTDTEMFDACANKTLDEIINMEDKDYQRQAIRYALSRILMNYPEENPLEVDIVMDMDEGFGLCDLQKLCVIKLSQTPCEGYINLMYRYCTDWEDIDTLSNNEQLQILEYIY